MKYKFQATDPEGSTITFEFEAVQINQVSEQFKQFLLGVGFSPNNVNVLFDGE